MIQIILGVIIVVLVLILLKQIYDRWIAKSCVVDYKGNTGGPQVHTSYNKTGQREFFVGKEHLLEPEQQLKTLNDEGYQEFYKSFLTADVFDSHSRFVQDAQNFSMGPAKYAVFDHDVNSNWTAFRPQQVDVDPSFMQQYSTNDSDYLPGSANRFYGLASGGDCSQPGKSVS